MSNKAKVQELLEARFSKTKIKHTKEGFKINKVEIDELELKQLAKVSDLCQMVYIKRSGQGLAIIVNPKPDEATINEPKERVRYLEIDKVFEVIDPMFKHAMLKADVYPDNDRRAVRWYQFDSIKGKRDRDSIRIDFKFSSSQTGEAITLTHFEKITDSTPDPEYVEMYFQDWKQLYERFKEMKYEIIGNNRRVQ